MTRIETRRTRVVGWLASLLATGAAWAGSNVVVSGPTTVDSRDYTLTVASPYPTPTPATGTNTYAWRSTVNCTVAGGSATTQSPVGWTGTGSVPATGIGLSTGALVLDEVAGSISSSITWRWLPSQDDPDCDGFSNLWESHFRTDPDDPADCPHGFSTVTVPTTNEADLQVALNSAPGFSRVLLQPGLYVGNFTVGTSLLIEGQDGFATICDGNTGGTVFTVAGNAHVVFHKLVVQRGRSALGSGINAQAARFVGIVDTKIDRNSASGQDGGGVYVGNTATLLNSVLSHNSAELGRGGAVYGSNAGYVRIRGSELTQNTALTAGGGVYLDQSCDAEIDGAAFSNNSSGQVVTNVPNIGLGGALYVNDNCTVTIKQASYDRNNAQGYAETSGLGGAIYARLSGLVRGKDLTFSRNRAWKDGGAVSATGSAQLFLADAVFDQNHADRNGGAVATFDSSNVTLDNVLAKGGFSGQLGGGFYITDSSVLTVTNGTVVGNTAADRGGGIAGEEVGATIRLRNTLVHGNRAGVGYPQVVRLMSATLEVTFCLVEGGYAGTGNLSGDPGFVNPGAWDDGGTPVDYTDDSWEDGDYHLTSASRARDSGSNSFVGADATTDLDGRARVFNDTVDMGAYEFVSVTHAMDDAYATLLDQTLSIPAPGVLANDIAPAGQTLTAIRVAEPSHGTLTLNANGRVVYTPSAGFLGTDSFTYKATDGTVNSNVATVTITVVEATATVVLSSLSHIYDGTPRNAAATTVPPGLSVLFTYNGTATPPVNAGTYTVIAFATDATHAGVSQGEMVIAKAVPVISWPAPTPITRGTALSAVHLNATASVAGAFAYTPSAGAVLSTGTHVLSVVFTPDAPANWAGATATTTLTVTPAEVEGQFSAVFLNPANPEGRRIWDFTGLYETLVGAHTLRLTLQHDAKGRLTGTGRISGPMPSGSAIDVPLTVKGAAISRIGAVSATLSMMGRTATSTVTLKLALVLDGGNLVGVYSESIADRVGGVARNDGVCVLPLDPAMDGQFQFDMTTSRDAKGRVTGHGVLTLANGRQVGVLVNGREASGTTTVHVTGDKGTDPLAGPHP
jgi:predicted outer membrane repeat protein